MKRTRLRRRKSLRRAGEKMPLKKRMDAMAKRLVLRRHGKACLKCGSMRRVQASHVMPKGAHPSMRYDIDNIIPLCWACHFTWWHKSPLAASGWFRQKFGNAAADILIVRAGSPGKVDLALTRVWLEQELEKSGA